MQDGVGEKIEEIILPIFHNLDTIPKKELYEKTIFFTSYNFNC